MFKFLFAKTKGTPVIEPQRKVVERALSDLNAVLAGLEPKAKITIDPATGGITLALPEQMPDETLALPAPEKASDTPDITAEKEPSEVAGKAA